MHTASRAVSSANKAFVVGEMHRQHMYVPSAGQEATAAVLGYRGDGNCSGWDVMFRWSDATSLHVCIYLYCTQQSTKLFEDSQPRNRRETTIDFFFCGGSANPQTDPNTRASHQSRHYSSHTTQLNQTQSRTILSLPTTTAADTPAQLQWLTATTN